MPVMLTSDGNALVTANGNVAIDPNCCCEEGFCQSCAGCPLTDYLVTVQPPNYFSVPGDETASGTLVCLGDGSYQNALSSSGLQLFVVCISGAWQIQIEGRIFTEDGSDPVISYLSSFIHQTCLLAATYNLTSQPGFTDVGPITIAISVP